MDYDSGFDSSVRDGSDMLHVISTWRYRYPLKRVHGYTRCCSPPMQPVLRPESDCSWLNSAEDGRLLLLEGKCPCQMPCVKCANVERFPQGFKRCFRVFRLALANHQIPGSLLACEFAPRVFVFSGIEQKIPRHHQHAVHLFRSFAAQQWATGEERGGYPRN